VPAIAEPTRLRRSEERLTLLILAMRFVFEQTSESYQSFGDKGMRWREFA